MLPHATAGVHAFDGLGSPRGHELHAQYAASSGKASASGEPAMFEFQQTAAATAPASLMHIMGPSCCFCEAAVSACRAVDAVA